MNRGKGRPPKAPAILQDLPDEIPREATMTPKKRRVNYDTPGTEEYSRMQIAVREVWILKLGMLYSHVLLIPSQKSNTGLYSIPNFRILSVARLAYFFPVLYIVDILCIILQAFGFKFHIEGGIPLLFCQLAYSFLATSFFTAFKSYFVQQI